MADPAEKTRSSALRPIAPPPLSQHLREFASRPDAWAVLARNLIPVVGIYGFGWSAALAMFNYWFDGLTALVAIVTALIPRALRETQPKSAGAVKNLLGGVLTWIFLVGIVGLPYWIVLIPLHDLLLGDERSEEHTSELQSHSDLVCRLLLEKKKPRRHRRAGQGAPGQRPDQGPGGRLQHHRAAGDAHLKGGWPDTRRSTHTPR